MQTFRLDGKLAERYLCILRSHSQMEESWKHTADEWTRQLDAAARFFVAGPLALLHILQPRDIRNYLSTASQGTFTHRWCPGTLVSGGSSERKRECLRRDNSKELQEVSTRQHCSIELGRVPCSPAMRILTNISDSAYGKRSAAQSVRVKQCLPACAAAQLCSTRNSK